MNDVTRPTGTIKVYVDADRYTAARRPNAGFNPFTDAGDV